MSSVTRGTGRPGKYRLENGEAVPSVTTVTSRFKESGGLIHWAWSCGIDGIDYRAQKDAAAGAGAIAHGLIEDWVHGEKLSADDAKNLRFWETDEQTLSQAIAAYAAFLEWAEQVKLEILETEVPLVSERYKFGGTLDANALIADKPKLLDWKSSNAVYPEYVVQLAAYRQLLRERFVLGGELAAPQSAQLLRVGKEFSDFHAHSYPATVLDLGWRWFLHAREMYEIDKDLKKACR